MKIVSQNFVDPPTQIDVSANVPVTLRKHLHNNGPYGPVVVSITATSSAPADCTATPAPGNPISVTLPVSVDTVVDEAWTIHCSQESTQTFTFQNQIALLDPQIIDPDLTNNSASTQLTINTWAEADLKIVSQQVINPPSTIAISQDVSVTVRALVHNNGPYTPLNALSEMVVTIPQDCTVSPPVHIQKFDNLPVSVDIVYYAPFVIHCFQVSAHTFTFDQQINVTTPHVRDPNPSNNSAHLVLTVAAVAEADIKIASASFVNPPTEITAAKGIDVTLRKHVHNNGPYGPLNISLAAQGSPPTGCTVAPKSVPTSINNVPVSVDQVVDEVWTIKCYLEGLRTFVFDESISVATLHVSDPNEANNANRKMLTVTVVPSPYYPFWADDICDGLDNDGDTLVDPGWDRNDNVISDCLDPALDSDSDTTTNDIEADDDGDGWTDAQEGQIHTDPENACPSDSYHDAWPPDVNNDRSVNIMDVLMYKAVLSGPYEPRYDVDVNGRVNIMDVLLYKRLLGSYCSP